MEIVVATGNAGKFAEFERLGREWPVHLHSLLAYPRIELPEEAGASFKENALIKARSVCCELGVVALADDSGLIVPALNGAPGIHSARYAGPSATAAENIQKLLLNLQGKGGSEREACFFCVLALVHPDGREWVVSGQCDGQIAETPSGGLGFGYDPVFWIREYGMSMAQLSPDLKNAISHRSKAIREIGPVILDLARESAQ